MYIKFWQIKIRTRLSCKKKLKIFCTTMHLSCVSYLVESLEIFGLKANFHDDLRNL